MIAEHRRSHEELMRELHRLLALIFQDDKKETL